MSTVDGSLVSAGSRPAPVNLLRPGLGACGLLASFRTGVGEWRGWARRSGRCMLAAGVAVAVALGPASGARTDRVTAAVMAEHGYALKTTALIRLGGMGVGRARCVVVAGVPWSIPSGMGPFHRGLDHLQQQLARARQVAVARLGGAWQAAGLSGRERSVSGRTGVWAPGVRHATEMPAVACRTMPSPQRADQARLSGQLIPRTPVAIRTLACMEWAPGGSVGSRRGGCVADVFGKDAHQRSEALADRGSRRFPGILDARLGVGAGDAGLRQIFAWAPGLADVMIHVNMRDAGAGMPAKACVAASGTGGQLSSGDRASLPGRSTRYRVIWLVCAHCGTKMACLFYDQGDIPVCANALHGRLEILR